MNKYRNESEIILNENTYKLAATFNTMVEIEEATGVSFPKLAQNFGEGNVQVIWLATILEKASGESREQIEQDIIVEGIVPSSIMLAEYFSIALYGSQSIEDYEDKKNKRRSQY